MKPKPDKKLRDMLFDPEAMHHPAKAHLGMMMEIFERYTKPGNTILDPMAGIGSTLVGCLMGCNVVCVELEEHFIRPMLASWEKMQQHGPMLGYEMGKALIVRGDARHLPLASVDCIVTSPPYEGCAVSGGDQARNPSFKWPHGEPTYRSVIKHDGYFVKGYTRPQAIITSPPYETGLGHGEGPLAGMPLKSYRTHRASYSVVPDAVITSPPYEGSIQGQPGIDWTKMDGSKRDMSKEQAQPTRIASLSGYTKSFKAIITSPPYGQAHSGGGIAQKGYSKLNQRDIMGGGKLDPVGKRSYLPENLGSLSNIGNLRSDAYWSAMKEVYQECYRVLAPGSIIVLILKGFTKSSQYVDLPQQTLTLVEALGFTLFDRWQRELWNLSFWRVLQKRNNPESWDERLRFEEILAFRKN